jgi:hypothetical protein
VFLELARMMKEKIIDAVDTEPPSHMELEGKS